MVQTDPSSLRESNFTDGYMGYTIYSLVNLENGKRYIGRTNHPRSRLKLHLYQLKNHRHPNPLLNKDSIYPFGFEILEDGVSYTREKELIFQYQTYEEDKGYNGNDPYAKVLKDYHPEEKEEITTLVGQKIRDRRKQLGLSQEELAILIGCKSKSTVCKVERGEDNLTILLLKRYADALETTPSELLEDL